MESSTASSATRDDDATASKVGRDLVAVMDDVIARQRDVIAHQKQTILAQRVTIDAYRAILRLHAIVGDSDG